jgi:methoxymalonate biosynthesis protein
VAEPALVKCVVWDLDGTLLAGVLAEADATPPLDPALRPVLAELAGRGVLAALASRNPAAAADRIAGLDWPAPFVSAQWGWGLKSESVRAVAAELGIGLDALAFVDDDPYERAEVAHALPEVLVLAPDEIADALCWPEFRPPAVTEDGRRRAESYARARLREAAARESGRDRPDFLRWCGTAVALGLATPTDLPRLHELSVRTHQFNSVRRALAEAELAGAGAVVTVRLSDRFGDDGLVGAAVLGQPLSTYDSPEWTVEAMLMSCRAMGRGVIEVLLGWLARRAAAAGAGTLAVPCRLDDRNVPLRLALVAAGFRAAAPGTAGAAAAGADTAAATGTDDRTWFRRPLTADLPAIPAWATVTAPEVPA